MSEGTGGISPESAFDATASAADDFVARVLAGTITGAELRVSVVTGVEGSGDYRVKTSATGADFWCASLDSSLRVGDRVLMLKQESAYVAVGRLNGGGGGVPIGTVVPYAGSDMPAGWLLCDGSAVSRTDFANLFASLGTSYGGGNGTTTFNLPTLTNRVPVGSGSRSRGATGGAESVTLSEGQIPGHRHTGGTDSSGSHTHSAGYGSGTAGVASGSGATVANSGGVTTGSAGSHSHGFTTDYTGGGGSHENMPPFQVLTYIIKAR